VHCGNSTIGSPLKGAWVVTVGASPDVRTREMSRVRTSFVRLAGSGVVPVAASVADSMMAIASS
jgi:hypothetical protein